MKAVRTLAVVLVTALAVGGAFTLLGGEDAITPPQVTSVDRAAKLSTTNAALTKQVEDLQIAIGATQAAACPECAQREAEAATPAVAAPAPKPKTRAKPPGSAKAWLALAKGGVFPPGFAAWLAADPAHLLEVIASLDGITDPKLSKALLDQIKRTRGALANPDVQRALFDLSQAAETPLGRTRALQLLGEAFKRDALASERLTPGERQQLAALALSGPPQVRRAALGALAHMPDDPAAIAAFTRAWNDPQLSDAARRQAIVGLRFAPQDVALPILLDSLTSPELPVQLRQQAAVSLSYLNPQTGGDQIFDRLAPTLANEPDWVAKGFTFVALMQIDNQRAHSLLRDLQLAERDPWNAEKYAALAEIAARESDYQRIVWQGIRAYRRIEARRAAESR
jgi:hypothetical protein